MLYHMRVPGPIVNGGGANTAAFHWQTGRVDAPLIWLMVLRGIWVDSVDIKTQKEIILRMWTR